MKTAARLLAASGRLLMFDASSHRGGSMLGRLLLAFVEIVIARSSHAASPPNHATVRIVAGPAVRGSTDERWLGLEFQLAPGWHVYWRNPGDAGSPPTASWDLPPRWELGEIRWPLPHRIEIPPLTAFGYENSVVFPMRLRAGLGGVERGVIRGRIAWVACKLECVAEEDSVTLRVAFHDSVAASDRQLIDASLQQLPSPIPAAWKIGAEPTGTAVVLTLAAPFRDSSTRGDFFPAEPAVIEHSAKVEASPRNARLTLHLPRSRYAPNTPARLRGLLVVRGGEPAAVARSYEVDVPVVARHALWASGTSPLALLLFAVLSGLLVNLMPCVFPLLAVKALSLASGTTSRIERVARATSYAAGSIVSCVAIGGLVLLASGPSRATWGFQMQSPRFLGLVAIVTVAAALNLFGAFELPSLWPSRMNIDTDRLGANLGAFVVGAAAILVGAPCTAPFFSATLTGALVAPRIVGMAAFVCFGIGAATPFVALALAPSLVARTPRTGRWLETLKQLLAFPLLTAAAWLFWVAQIQTGPAGSALLLGALIGVALALWILGRWSGVATTPVARRAARVAVASIVAVAVFGVVSLDVAPRPQALESATTVRWQAYDDARLDSLRAAGRPVLVDFTAAWCLTCKVNEVGALSTERVTATVRAHSVGLLRADLTVADTALTRALHAVGAASVPTYAVYPAGGLREPRLLPLLLTPNIVVNAIERAVAQSAPATVSSTFAGPLQPSTRKP